MFVVVVAAKTYSVAWVKSSGRPSVCLSAVPPTEVSSGCRSLDSLERKNPARERVPLEFFFASDALLRYQKQ